jgi:putative membrane protein
MIRLATVLGLAGTALLTGLLIWHGVGPVFAALMAAGIGLVWASLFHIVPMTINAYAWRVLFAVPPRPSWVQMTVAVWIRESVNGLLPVARIGGEIVSYRVLSRFGFKPVAVVAGLIADMTLSIISQFLFTVLGLVLLLLRIDDTAAIWRILGGLMVFVPMVVGLVVVQRMGMVNLGAKLVGTLFGTRWAELVGNASRLDEMLRLIYRRPSRVAVSVAVQLLGWIVGAGEIWIALYYLGHRVAITDALALEALSQAVSSAAFLVPGAIGVQEGGFVLFASLLGLGPEIGLAIAFTRRFRDLVLFLPGLVVWQLGEAHGLVFRRRRPQPAAE